MEELEEKQIVAKNLEYFRKRANLSQLDLAKKLNYSNKNISKWENAETTPSIFVLNRIAKLYNITVDDLLKESQESDQPSTNKKLVLEGRKKTIFRLAMLALANAIMFMVCSVAIYVLGLINITVFNKWMIYLYLTPLTVLSIIIYVRVLYKRASLTLISLFGWLICFCVYISLPQVENIVLVFVLGAAYQLMVIFITILVNLKLSLKAQSIFNRIFKSKKTQTQVEPAISKENINLQPLQNQGEDKA